MDKCICPKEDYIQLQSVGEGLFKGSSKELGETKNMDPRFKYPQSCQESSLPQQACPLIRAVSTFTAVTFLCYHGISFSVAGTWDSFSERHPVRTKNAAVNAVTHPWPGQGLLLRNGTRVGSSSGGSYSNMLDVKTLADDTQLENFHYRTESHEKSFSLILSHFTVKETEPQRN